MLILRKQRLVAGALALFVLTIVVAGCSLTDKVQSWRQGGQSQVESTEGIPEEAEIVAPEESIEVNLYFSDSTGKKLVEEQRSIPKVEGIARATLEELIKGPSEQSGLLPTIPAGAKLLDINLKPDGEAIIDFSPEIGSNHTGEKEGENLTVYSIVNTLTQFPTVKSVRFRIGGQDVKTLAGNVNLDQPVFRNDEIIK